MDEVRQQEDLERPLGPKLRALLLAQPLNQLVPLQFSELPSRRGTYGSAASSSSDNEQHGAERQAA